MDTKKMTADWFTRIVNDVIDALKKLIAFIEKMAPRFEQNHLGDNDPEKIFTENE